MNLTRPLLLMLQLSDKNTANFFSNADSLACSFIKAFLILVIHSRYPQSTSNTVTTDGIINKMVFCIVSGLHIS